MSKEKSPACAETGQAEQQNVTACPVWCLGGHDQPSAFHHMGGGLRLVPATQPLGPPHEQEVRVVASAFVDEDFGQRPAIVELRIGEGTSYALAELQPAEARLLASQLSATANVADTATRRPVSAVDPIWWQSKPCPTWCGYPDGHHAAEAYDDRTCFSGTRGAERRITLSLDESTIVVDGHDRTPEIATLDVYLRQHYREVAPRVSLSHNELRSLDLTLEEAAELRRHLDELLEAASCG